MAQKTAVDWIIEQLQAPCRGIPSHIIEQAKQIEKDQIINAVRSECIYTNRQEIAEHYYNETYGTE
jgi:hypothetical protein